MSQLDLAPDGIRLAVDPDVGLPPEVDELRAQPDIEPGDALDMSNRMRFEIALTSSRSWLG